MTIRSCNVDVHTVKMKVFPCVFSSYILIAQSKFFFQEQEFWVLKKSTVLGKTDIIE